MLLTIGAWIVLCYQIFNLVVTLMVGGTKIQGDKVAEGCINIIAQLIFGGITIAVCIGVILL
jgi:hypothetical protein